MNLLYKVDSMLLTNMYDVYKGGNPTSRSLYKNAHDRIFPSIKVFFKILLNVGVYASVIAIIVSAILLFVASDRGPKALQEGKDHIKRVLIISMMMASILKIITLVFRLGL